MVLHTSDGTSFTIDDEDAAVVTPLRWWSSPRDGYTTYIYTQLKGRTVYLHRLLTGFVGVVDHTDGDGTNNTRQNMRVGTHAANMRNTRVRRDSLSGIKGVRFDRKRGRFFAYAYRNGKRISAGAAHLDAESATKAATALRAKLREEGL